MISMPRLEKKDWMEVLRLKTDSPDPIVRDFKKAGFNVSYAALSVNREKYPEEIALFIAPGLSHSFSEKCGIEA